MVRRGKYIVFEGIGASGKDTQAAMAEGFLKSLGLKVLMTREHTRDTPPGELIEDIIKKRKDQIEPVALQLLYICDRRNHDMEVVRPALDEYDFVIGNRSYPTTVAYSPDGWREFILKTNQSLVTRPDVVFIIDTTPEESIKRMDNRGGHDIFDTLETMRRCREGYRWYYQKSGDNCVLIDGNGTREEVFEQVKKELNNRNLLEK